MLGALLILIGSLGIGTFFTKQLKLRTTILETAILIYFLGTLIGTWAALGITTVLGYAWIVPIFSFFTLFFVYEHRWLKQNCIPTVASFFSRKKYPIYLVSAALCLVFVPLFFSHMLFEKDGSYWSGGSTWGDLALHVTFIRQFARQETLDLTSPIYSQVQTNYPFLLNFLAGILFRNGMSLQASLLLTGLPLLLASCLLWYQAMLRLSGSARAAWVSMVLFFGNGGLGFITAYQEYIHSKIPFLTFLFHQTKNYTHIEAHGIYWSNSIVDIFLPQRTFIAGFAFFILFFWLLTYQLAHPKSIQKTWLAMLGITALTPLFHTHTFLTLCGLLVCITGYYLYHHQLRLKYVLLKVMFFLLLTIPQFAWQAAHTATSDSFISLKLGWYTEKGQSILQFWFENMGVSLVFVGVAIVWLFVTIREKMLLKISLLALISLFGIANIFQFQPFLFDNMKFMVLGYFAVTITIGLIISRLSFRKVWFVWILMPIALLSGTLAIIREQTLLWKMADLKSIEQSKALREILPQGAIVLTADSHTHPIPFLVGNPVVMGYRGWLWSHGFNYQQTERDVQTMFAGTRESAELLEKYHVSYVYISELERKQYFVQDAYFTKYPSVYENGTVRVYKITKD